MQRRWWLRSLYAALGLAVGALVLGVTLALTRGTPVEVQPPEASENARIELASGWALVILGRVYDLGGELEVRVSAPGFAARTLPIHTPGRTLSVALEPLPGRVHASTHPPEVETRWYVDDALAGIGALLEHELHAGAYRLSARHDWYEIADLDIQVERGARLEVSLPLSRARGRLELRSEPSGASVEIEGLDPLPTPLERELPAGRYPVALRLPGYAPVRDTLELTRDRPLARRNYRLVPPSAELRFDLSPAGGLLLVDGFRASNPERVAAHAEHSVRYSLEGYFPRTLHATLDRGETRTLELHLTRKTGRARIESDPVSEVRIDGEPAGRTPLDLVLPAQETRIELQRRGYETVRRTLAPDPERATLLRETLLTEREARLARAPVRYTNSVGASLVLLNPGAAGAFRMGDPRGEKGQRANEFERDVRLSRPFYAGLHEVSLEQFRSFRPGHPGERGDHPATSVSWAEAVAFCDWLSVREGLTPFYAHAGGGQDPPDGYRLLTEAEWEWLARQAGRGRRTVFPWGDSDTLPSGVGNVADETAKGSVETYVPRYSDGFARLAPVGSFAPERSGLFDLTGNASEWVHDFYLLEPPAPGSVEIDPLGPGYGSVHVVKGASWRTGTRSGLRAARREGFGGRRDDLGFRIGRYL
ncbi:MAG: SUMF1/EgtB/PvdO family nonheme iron enzyme [Proteobacteria bacterium]|nr:SUMF1/EgtB/PvdO family nonheme iron enzyme [Pseudomonadota bacterium]